MELESNSVCFILLSGAFHLVLTCLMSLNLVLMNYMKNLQYDLKDKYVNSKKISEIIDNGFTLVELSKSANIIFGKLLALEYLSNMGMNVVATFISLNIFKALSTFEPTLFLLSIGSFIVVISYYIKLYYYARVGQNLCNAYKEISKELGKLLLHDSIIDTDKQRRELEYLFNRFSIPSPIRPLDMFNMNYAHFAVLSNMIFTYTIILMQFKGY